MVTPDFQENLREFGGILVYLIFYLNDIQIWYESLFFLGKVYNLLAECSIY